MDEHKKSIIEFTKEKHPNYKEKSAMFRRKASQYGREVVFYRETFIDYKGLSTKEILERLYPKPINKNKSLIIDFDA